MEYTELGTTGERVSRIAFGCAPMGGHDYGAVNDEDSIAAVHRALDLGINLFDTADVYGLGHAEEVLGRALRGRRREAFVATKVGVAFDAQGRTRRDLSPAWIRTAVDRSLSRLSIDMIDLYQVHWPDPSIPLVDTMGAMLELQRMGKVRYIGVCNFAEALVRSTLEMARIETFQVSYNVADWRSAAELFATPDEFKLTPLTYNSLAQGILSGKYDASAEFAGTDRRQRSGYFQGPKHQSLLQVVGRIRTLAGGTRSCAAVALRWILESWKPACAIVGIKTPTQAFQAAEAAKFSLSPTEVEWLREKSMLEPVST